MEIEYDGTANIYAYAKLYHNKRPGVWTSSDDIRLIYNILSYLPTNLQLLKRTAIRTEFEDVTTATPDLYSKICSNGNISSALLNSNLIQQQQQTNNLEEQQQQQTNSTQQTQTQQSITNNSSSNGNGIGVIDIENDIGIIDQIQLNTNNIIQNDNDDQLSAVIITDAQNIDDVIG